jgi:hypothetical protein
MLVRSYPLRRVLAAVAIALAAGIVSAPVAQSQAGLRPMTFLDMRHTRTVAAPTPSPDGQWMLYTLSTPDWKEAKTQTDLYLVSIKEGVSSTRQMTFTKEKNESSPRWASDGRAFFFLSNRDAPESASTRNQLYLMRPDGGEAQRLTDTREGVRDYQLSKDGRWLVYRTGKDGEEQLYRLAVTDHRGPPRAEQITHPTGVGTWRWAPDSTRIYFVSPDELDADEKERREKKFTVDIRNMETPSASLWALDLDPRGSTKKLTDGTQYAATQFTISDDSRWVGLPRPVARALRARHHRGIALRRPLSARTGDRRHRAADRQLRGVGERAQLLARLAVDRLRRADDTTRYTMSNSRVYMRASAIAASRSASSGTRSTATSASASGRKTATRSTSTRGSARPTS